jgi:hypothetical protein
MTEDIRPPVVQLAIGRRTASMMLTRATAKAAMAASHVASEPSAGVRPS